MLLWATASSHLGLLAQLQSHSSVPSRIRHQIPLSPNDSCSCFFNGSPSSINCSQTPQLHTLASLYSCQSAHEKWPGCFTCISLITLARHFFSTHLSVTCVTWWLAYALLCSFLDWTFIFSYWFAKAFYNIDPLSFIYYQYFSQVCWLAFTFIYDLYWYTNV